MFGRTAWVSFGMGFETAGKIYRIVWSLKKPKNDVIKVEFPLLESVSDHRQICLNIPGYDSQCAVSKDPTSPKKE